MISKTLFILGSYKFLAYLECIRSYAWSFGHSDPDLSSVLNEWQRFHFNLKKSKLKVGSQSFIRIIIKKTLKLGLHSFFGGPLKNVIKIAEIKL